MDRWKQLHSEAALQESLQLGLGWLWWGEALKPLDIGIGKLNYWKSHKIIKNSKGNRNSHWRFIACKNQRWYHVITGNLDRFIITSINSITSKEVATWVLVALDCRISVIQSDLAFWQLRMIQSEITASIAVFLTFPCASTVDLECLSVLQCNTAWTYQLTTYQLVLVNLPWWSNHTIYIRSLVTWLPGDQRAAIPWPAKVRWRADRLGGRSRPRSWAQGVTGNRRRCFQVISVTDISWYSNQCSW